MNVERSGEPFSSSSAASPFERKGEQRQTENRDVRQLSSELSSPAEEESELSSLTDEESLEEEDDGDEVNVAKAIRSGHSLRDLTKVTITPHRRAEKHGRPTRRTAAAASSAWSHLTPKAYDRQSELSSGDDIETLEDVRSPTSKRKRRPAEDKQPSTHGKVRQTPKKQKEQESVYSTPRKSTKAAEDRTASAVRFARKSQANLVRDDEEDPRQGGESLIRPTSSDAYFANHAPGQSRRNQTSDNLISQIFPAISSRAVMNLGNRIAKNVASSLDDDGPQSVASAAVPPIVPLHPFADAHEQWWSMLRSCNRPLLFYGVGSKRAPLQRFARDMARKGRCCVVVVRGEVGGRIEEVVSQLERICSISPTLDVSRARRMAASSALEARVEHIVRILHEEDKEDDDNDDNEFIPPSIMLLLHNIDAPALMQEKSLRLLGLLSQSRRIHICADTVHLNVAMLAGIEITPYFNERLRWLWIDLTTYIPLLEETIGEKGAGVGRTLGLPSVLDVRRAGAGSDAAALAIDSATTNVRGSGAADGQTGLLTDRAAMHILRSVTFKARGLFLLLAARLLQQQQREGEVRESEGSNLTTPTVLYTELTDLARSNFLAMTTDALRALLVEFTTHGLIHHGSDGKVQIKLSKEDLQHVVDTFASGRGD